MAQNDFKTNPIIEILELKGANQLDEENHFKNLRGVYFVEQNSFTRIPGKTTYLKVEKPVNGFIHIQPPNGYPTEIINFGDVIGFGQLVYNDLAFTLDGTFNNKKSYSNIDFITSNDCALVNSWFEIPFLLKKFSGFHLFTQKHSASHYSFHSSSNKILLKRKGEYRIYIKLSFNEVDETRIARLRISKGDYANPTFPFCFLKTDYDAGGGSGGGSGSGGNGGGASGYSSLTAHLQVKIKKPSNLRIELNQLLNMAEYNSVVISIIKTDLNRVSLYRGKASISARMVINRN